MAHGQPSTNKINPVKRKNDDNYFFVMIFIIMAMSMNLRLMMIMTFHLYSNQKSKTHHPKHSTAAKKTILLCLLPV